MGEGEGGVVVVHCYGHGGSGVTIGMGCADDVVTNHLVPRLGLQLKQHSSLLTSFSSSAGVSVSVSGACATPCSASLTSDRCQQHLSSSSSCATSSPSCCSLFSAAKKQDGEYGCQGKGQQGQQGHCVWWAKTLFVVSTLVILSLPSYQ